MGTPERAASQPQNRGTEALQVFEQFRRGFVQAVVRNDTSHKTEQLRFGSAELAAGKNQIGGSAHADEFGQSEHGDGRKTTELDFGLAELGRAGRDEEVAEGGEFHAA